MNEPAQNHSQSLSSQDGRFSDSLALVEQFEQQWRSGGQPRIEKIVDALPRERRGGALVDLVAVEVQLRRAAGENLEVQEFEARFPEFRDAVHDGFAAANRSGSQADSALMSTDARAQEAPSLETTVDRQTDQESQAPDSLSTGKSLVVGGTRYEVEGELARGGMGVIFRARDNQLGRRLAMKVLLDPEAPPELQSRFVEEAQIGGQLQHPGIVPVYELGEFPDRRPYFTMKLIEGRPLSSLLRRRGDIREELGRLLGIFEQITQAVAYAHHCGVIHRDLKPQNVMVGAFGEVQVMDWGLAKVLGGGVLEQNRSGASPAPRDHGSPSAQRSSREPQRQETMSGAVMGTPSYMSPEQARGEIEKVDARSDVFGLGAILCEILSGKPPYIGRSRSEILSQAREAKLDDAFRRLDRVPEDPELIAIAKRCLAAAPADRPQDSSQLANLISSYLESVDQRLRAAEVAQAEATVKAIEERKRRRVSWALATTLVFAVLVGAAAWVIRLQRREAVARREAATAFRLSQDIAEAVREAETYRDQAFATQPADRVAFAKAVESVRRAKSLADSGRHDIALQERVAKLSSRLGKQNQELDLLQRLRSAEDESSRPSATLRRFADEHAIGAYESAFRDYGVNVDAETPAEFAQWIADKSELARASVLDAVVQWHELTPPGAGIVTRIFNKKLLVDFVLPNASAKLQELDSGDRILRVESGGVTLDLEGADDAGLQEAASLLSAAPGVVVDFEALQQSKGQRVRVSATGSGRRQWLRATMALAEPNSWRQPLLQDRLRREELIQMANDPQCLQQNSTTLVVLARALNGAGEQQAATRLLEQAVTRQPDNVRLHIVLAQQAWHNDPRDMERAVRHFSIAHATEPDNDGVALNLATTLLGKIDQADEAERLLRSVLSRRPDNPAALASLGSALFSQKRFAEAQEVTERALQIWPDSAIALGNYSTILNELGRWDEGFEALKKAVRLRPEQSSFQFNIGVYLERSGDTAGAEDAYRAAMAGTPQIPEPYYNLAMLLSRAGRLEEGIPLLKRAIELRPQSTQFHRALGTTFLQLQQNGKAVAAYQTALRIADDPKARTNLAHCLMQLGRLEEAVREYDLLIPASPQDGFPFRDRAIARGRMRQFEESLKDLQTASKLLPRDATTWFLLAMTFKYLGRFSDATAILETAPSLQGTAQMRNAAEKLQRFAELEAELGQTPASELPPEAWSEAAEVCLCLRRYADAAGLYSKILSAQTPPDDPPWTEGALASLQAAAGWGERGFELGARQRAPLRAQALVWLQAELRSLQELLTTEESESAASRVRARVRLWLAHDAFSSVRSAQRLADLPESEAAEWQEFWSELRQLDRRLDSP